jgi:hypothetical protein
MPLHETVSRFEAGGPERGREIAKIYQELSDILDDLYDDDEPDR